MLRGFKDKEVEMRIIDQKNSRLDWLKFQPEDIRLLYPYHLHCVFREECMGQYPEFYVTIIREDVPLYSILEKQINLHILPIEENKRVSEKHYVALQASTYPKLVFPEFLLVNLKNYNTFASINKLLDTDRNWGILVPVASTRSYEQKDLSVLKSLTTRSLHAFLLSFKNWKAVFHEGIISEKNLEMIDSLHAFESGLKKIY